MMALVRSFIQHFLFNQGGRNVNDKNAQIIIGAYYELPDGRIALTVGWDGLDRTVRYHFDTDEPSGKISETGIKSWKYRADLKDFPNARDPRLPYVFDLYWDLKFTSDLQRFLQQDYHEDMEEVRALALEHGLTIGAPAPKI